MHSLHPLHWSSTITGMNPPSLPVGGSCAALLQAAKYSLRPVEIKYAAGAGFTRLHGGISRIRPATLHVAHHLAHEGRGDQGMTAHRGELSHGLFGQQRGVPVNTKRDVDGVRLQLHLVAERKHILHDTTDGHRDAQILGFQSPEHLLYCLLYTSPSPRD